MWKRSRRLGLGLTVWAALTIQASVDGQVVDAQIWLRTFPEDVTTLSLSELGTVLAQRDDGLAALDLQSGQELWSHPDVVDHVPIAGTGMLIAGRRDRSRVVLDLMSGRERWSLASLGIRGEPTVLHAPGSDLVLVSGPSGASPHTLLAVSASTGEVVWRQDALFPEADAGRISYSRRQPALVGEDLLLLDPTHEGLLLLAASTGRALWRIPENVIKEPAAVADGAAPALVAGGRLFLPVKKSLAAVDLESGRVLWTVRPEFSKVVTQLQMTQAGLLVRGSFSTDDNGRRSWDSYLVLVDPDSGAITWNTDRQRPRLDVRSPFLLEGTAVVVALPEAIATLDLVTGRVLHSTPRPKFEGGEDPDRIERLEDGDLLLWSSQNLQRLPSEGPLAFRRYYHAPGASLLAKIGTTALAVGIGAAVSSAMHLTHPYVPGNPLLFARYKATATAAQFMYILTSDASPGGREGVSLVRLHRETGAEHGRVWFRDRSPVFHVDPVLGAVVTADGGKVWTARFAEDQPVQSNTRSPQ